MQKSFSLFRMALVMSLWTAVWTLTALVPPHPKYENPPQNFVPTRIESMRTNFANKEDIPNNILVLRVQFGDVSFRESEAYPDFLAHDFAFFDRWMVHLHDFFDDASHSQYNLAYTLYPEVITLARPMSYYGSDSTERIDARIPELVADMVSIVDSQIDFNSYGGLIIFHAGAGQESDISKIRSEQIWSTFITRRDLQDYYEPENDSYPGYPTDDGAILKNIVLVPESQYQDYFPAEGEENAEAYLFSIYGVLTHQFGHLIGLPTLFDNDSSNGYSQGIGNWGLMGTGVWNGNGYVPAQVSAWCRMYLGWEDVITINEDTEDIVVDYFLDHNPSAKRLYKVPISSTEYFLIENRQQNPDASLNPYNGQPSYSFKLLPAGEQEYYENYPELPYFNFMTNRYIGSEWDFFLPGLGGPVPSGNPVDGSGLLIWHIDENIINANFTANFDRNRINSDASHKGVDLEEADGIQNLDTAVYDIYKYGSPFDSFRKDNNDYFGNQLVDGILRLPAAESYYGGVPLEIYNISPSANQMSFSLRFQNSLNADYEGENTIPAALLDFDADGSMEIFHPMPDGKLVMWKDDVIMEGFPYQINPIEELYMWDGENIYIPSQLGSVARLYRLSMDGLHLLENFPGYTWASHPVNAGNFVACPLNSSDGTSKIHYYTKLSEMIAFDKSFEDIITANLIYMSGSIWALTHNSTTGYTLHSGIAGSFAYDYHPASIPIPADSLIVSIALAPIRQNDFNREIVIQTPNAVYLLATPDSSSFTFDIVEPFPFVHNLASLAPITIADVDRNSYLDILIGGENGFAVIDYAAQLISPKEFSLSMPDSLGISSGVLALDLDADGKSEYLGNFSRNRQVVWEENFRPKASFPVSYAFRSRSLPMIGEAMDGKPYIYSATDNGRIYRRVLPDARMEDIDMGWFTEYANLERSASRNLPEWQNSFQSASIFVPNETYIFPNPLKSIYEQKISLNVMTSKDAELELNIYDVSGSLVYTKKGYTKAYLRNREVIPMPSHKLSSGVYFAVIKAGKETQTLKFAVEK